jgi:hypothetical protein
MRKLIGVAILSLAAALAHAGELSPTAKIEIDALLSRLETSECQFYRNGSWYTAAEAKDHLRLKLDYLVKKGTVTTAEEFIERAATKSIVSGQPYRLRCANQEEQPSAVWLSGELRRYRGEHAK